jgi:hypothetical protein
MNKLMFVFCMALSTICFPIFMLEQYTRMKRLNFSTFKSFAIVDGLCTPSKKSIVDSDSLFAEFCSDRNSLKWNSGILSNSLNIFVSKPWIFPKHIEFNVLI